MDQHLHRPAAQAGRDLPAQQTGGGAGDEHLDAAAIDHPTQQPLPPRNVLHLIEIQGGAAVPAGPRRKAAGVFFEQPAEVGDGDAGKPLVLEQKQQLRFGWRSGVQPAGAVRSEKRGLAATTHTDYGKRLAGDRGKPHVSSRKVRRWDG